MARCRWCGGATYFEHSRETGYFEHCWNCGREWDLSGYIAKLKRESSPRPRWVPRGAYAKAPSPVKTPSENEF